VAVQGYLPLLRSQNENMCCSRTSWLLSLIQW